MNNNIANSPVPELSYTRLPRRETEGSQPRPCEGRHQRKCYVCRHPERDAIEEAFIHWQSPNEIATDYELPDPRPLYRHAHATGLFARRQRNLRFALENYIERVSEIEAVTPDAIIRAIRALSHVTKTGEWVEPPRQITVVHVKAADVPEAEPNSEPDIMQIITPKPHLSRLPRTRSREPATAVQGSVRPNPNGHAGIRTCRNSLKTNEGGLL
jgi:hypothetical protein